MAPHGAVSRDERDNQPPSRSEFVVSHHLDGFTAPSPVGLLHPTHGHGVHSISRRLPSPFPHCATPFEALPPYKARPCHHDRCPLAVTSRPRDADFEALPCRDPLTSRAIADSGRPVAPLGFSARKGTRQNSRSDSLHTTLREHEAVPECTGHTPGTNPEYGPNRQTGKPAMCSLSSPHRASALCGRASPSTPKGSSDVHLPGTNPDQTMARANATMRPKPHRLKLFCFTPRSLPLPSPLAWPCRAPHKSKANPRSCAAAEAAAGNPTDARLLERTSLPRADVTVTWGEPIAGSWGRPPPSTSSSTRQDCRFREGHYPPKWKCTARPECLALTWEARRDR
jgi:hypothetical protein